MAAVRVASIPFGVPSFGNPAAFVCDDRYYYVAILSGDRRHVHIARAGQGENGVTRTIDLPDDRAQSVALTADKTDGAYPRLMVSLLCVEDNGNRHADIYDADISLAYGTPTPAAAPAGAPATLDSIKADTAAIRAKVGA